MGFFVLFFQVCTYLIVNIDNKSKSCDIETVQSA